MIRDACELSILFVPLLFMSEFICKFYVASHILPVFSALLSFCVILSRSASIAIKKWLFSVPSTLALWLFFYYTNFSVRMTNTLYPRYGRISAGGGFAFMVTLMTFGFALIVGNILATLLSEVLNNRMPKIRAAIQNVILPVICLLILLAVIYFELTMPSWETIMQSVYG